MAKVLIDIPAENYDGWRKHKFFGHSLSITEEAVANGIALDELTNGEVIQKMFPNAKVTIDGTTVCLKFEYYHEIWFDLDWWNAKWGE